MDHVTTTMDSPLPWTSEIPVFDGSKAWQETNHSNNATEKVISKNIMIPAFMFLVGVFGNVFALIILIVRPSKDSRSTAFYHLVKALAIMDLFGIVALSPVTICVYLMGGIYNTGGSPLCNYFSFMLVMAGNATLFIVLVMAVERFMVTKCPYKYQHWVTPTSVNVCIATVWGLAILIALLPVVGLGRNTARWPGSWCFFDYRGDDTASQVYSFFYAITGILVIVITIVLNGYVIQHLWRMRTTRLSSSIRSASTNHSGSSGTSVKREPDSEKRMVIFLMAIIVVFTVCYAPLMVRIMINQIWIAGKDVPIGGVDDNLDLWTLRLASLNQILDPWVYIISRFTCCSGQRPKSEHVTSVCTENVIDGQSATHGRENRLHRVLQSFRTFVGKRKTTSRKTENNLHPLCSSEFVQNSSTPLKKMVHQDTKISFVHEDV